MHLQSRNVKYNENGYRTFSIKEAQEFITEKVRQYRIILRNIPLYDYCDLGFYADCYLIKDAITRYALPNKIYFGKGITDLQSRLSGMFESIERISALFSHGFDYITGSYNELRFKGFNLLNPLDVLMPSRFNIESSKYYSSTVSIDYTHNHVIDWFRTFSVAEKRDIYVPVCFTHLLGPDDKRNHISDNRPNGLASGCSFEEAILGGVFEVIERDACCIFAANSLPLPEVIPETIQIPEVQDFLRKVAKAHVKVTIKNITSDINIPTFCTFLHDQTPNVPKTTSGIGTHFSKEIALLRSITEACLDRAFFRCQFSKVLNTRLEELPDHLRWEAQMYKSKILGGRWYKTDYIHAHRYRQDYNEIGTRTFIDLKDAIHAAFNILFDSGITQIYIANLTRYEIPTVRILIPELEFVTKMFYVYKNEEDGKKNVSRRLHMAPINMGYVEDVDFSYLSGSENDLLL